MLGKALSMIGVGGVKVDAVLDRAIIAFGEEFTGTVHITGGKVEQTITGVSLDLWTQVEREVDDQKVHESRLLERAGLRETFTMGPGQRMEFPFTFAPPPWTPVSLPGRAVPLWLQTSLDVSMAVDPTDRDYLQVLPSPGMQSVLDAMGLLGFRLGKMDVEHRPRWSNGAGLVQEWEFRPASRGTRGFDEIEIVFEPDGAALGLLVQIDRSARSFGGFLAEMTGADESWMRLRLEPWLLNQGAHAVAQALSESFDGR